MRKIYSEYNNVSVPSESGTSEYGVYERFVNKDTGEVSLRLVKKMDRYSDIQEAAIGTTLQELIAKYESGEIVDFNFRQGQYLDLSKLPSSVMESLNLLKSIDNLDLINDYLRKLNNDVNKNNLDVNVNLEEKEGDKNEKK
jgi:hypothetical protein